MILRCATAAGFTALALVAMPAAHAAESYDNCTGFIDSVPAMISTQGTWCLRKDVATALTGVVAINIATNNVTIDCNDFKLGGLGAGMGTISIGIWAGTQQNITVRQCNIRGFLKGVQLGGAGHVIENNRFNGNTHMGIDLVASGSTIRGNTISTTGGSTQSAYAYNAFGINAADDVDVIDNTIEGVSPAGDGSGDGEATGIYTYGSLAGTVSGNRIRGVVGRGTGSDRAIVNGANGRLHVFDNVMTGSGRVQSLGIICESAQGVVARNLISGFTTALGNCTDGGGNSVH